MFSARYFSSGPLLLWIPVKLPGLNAYCVSSLGFFVVCCVGNDEQTAAVSERVAFCNTTRWMTHYTDIQIVLIYDLPFESVSSAKCIPHI